MKKIFYLIPLFLLFLIPKVHALPNCSAISNAVLYDVYSATSVGSISTYNTSGLLCENIFDANATSDSSQGLGWSIRLTNFNMGNSYYQLDVYMYIDGTGTPAIINSPFRNNSIAIGESAGASLWKNGYLNVSDLSYKINTYYSGATYGRTYYVVSYIFKANVSFNTIFVPFATSHNFTGGYQLEGINLTNTGSASLTETEINNLLSNQTKEFETKINEIETNINDNISDVENNLNQSIIDSNNSTQDTINSGLQSCSPKLNFSLTKGKSFNSSGVLVDSDNSYYTENYYSLNNATKITIENSGAKYPSSVGYIIIYDINKNYLDYFTINDKSFNLGNYDAYYFRLSTTNTSVRLYNGNGCVSKIDETNDKLDDLNSSINDSNSSGATDSAGGFFNNFEDNDFGLSGIITAPLNTIKTITSNSCTPLNLTIPFVNKEMSLPCMTDIYEEHFGSFLDIYQIITFGIISYWVCVQIYAMVKGFKNPDKDEIEVMDL